jgi:integrase
MAKAPGTIRRRGVGWNVIIRVEGERHEYGPRSVKLLRQASRTEVEEWVWHEYRRLVEQAKREADGAAGVVRFSELLRLFREHEIPTLSKGAAESYEDSFKLFTKYFVEMHDDPALHEIRPAHVKEYLAWRRVSRQARPVAKPRKGQRPPRPLPPVSNHTIARDRRALNRLLNYAVAMEYTDSNPCAAVPAPRADERTPHILSATEYERLLDACGDDDTLRLYVLVLAESGCRSYSEALHVRWEDVDLAGGFLNIVSGRDSHRTKAGKSRWTPLTPRLADALRAHMARHRLATYNGVRSPWVFHHTQTQRNAKAGDRIKALEKRFRDAVERAGVPRIRQHDLRHRRVTLWLAEGRNPVHVKEAVGHSDLGTTMKYTHLAREHLRALVDDAPPAMPVGKNA